ncbi:MAG TPA: hypothetical protein VFZ09_26130 [Archangium sp.]|uniref:hypothetical protein n=1 Tax=Archangium sp. TaxID=1872627 RepID=UPI002E3800F7|nr:hypothetical protein [Archangium sp.]HEX5749737.1 hypothetical protein [Archangium sp.]
MKRMHEKQWAALLGAAALALVGGCEPTEPRPVEAAPATPAGDLQAESLHPERRGIGALPLAGPTGPSALAVAVDPRRSLVVTDQVILGRFPFLDVMNQLIATSGVPKTPLDLFRQWWDTARLGPGLGMGPNCNSPGVANMNGFPYACPRAEGNQALVDPFVSPATNPDSYIPVGLFNRFDLAPADGANCGEYRVVFAKRSGITNPGNRNLVIFEAVLPNPTPALGLEGCRPVADFWANLTTDPLATSRANRLRDFYFVGLPGFMPVLHIDNLGNRPPGTTGQVRTNQFMSPNWLLREFKIQKPCFGTSTSGTSCTLQFIPVTVKTNPGGTLFNAGSAHPLAGSFQNVDFPGQVSNLAINDINLFSMAFADNVNSGQSDAQSPLENHYVNQAAGNAALMNNIQLKLNAIPSTLTPPQIVARSMALSCAGCHQLSNGANLGGGITWPGSLGFVHVSEQTDPGPDGPRHRISPALNTTFIPHRKAVFETFLNSACGDSVCDAWETPASCSADC